MLLSPPLNNCVITQFSVITRLHRLARTNVVCNNSESITLLAERFPAAPSVEGGGAEGEEVGRFALNDIPPALRGNSIEDRESVVFFFSLFFLLFPPPFIQRDKYCRFIIEIKIESGERGKRQQVSFLFSSGSGSGAGFSRVFEF